MDKKKLIIIIAIGLVVILGVVFLLFTKKETTTCTKKTNTAEFEIRDKIKFTIKDNKVFKVDLTKEVEVKDNDINVDTFMKSMNTTLETAYKYASENAYEIEAKDKTISLVMNSKKYGVILDNILIEENESTGSYSFVALNVIETEPNAIKIGDAYDLAAIKNKAKEVGYTCN